MFESPPEPPAIVGRATVIDGDTLDMRGERIRLWGVDAPESRQTCERRGQTWRCGQVAANSLSDWIGDRTVACIPLGRPDRYGRIVARCTVQGIDVGGWLVDGGLALDFRRYSQGAYQARQVVAARRRLGMHDGRFIAPWAWRAR